MGWIASDCLLKQHTLDLDISPLALRCANDLAWARPLTLSPLARVCLGVSLTCDSTATHTHTHSYARTLSACSKPAEVICDLSLLCCHLTRIDFFSYFPSSLLHLLPPNVSLPLWHQACSPPPTCLSQFSSSLDRSSHLL